MLNHITIMGRFVRDPELRRTGKGTAVAGFTLAVDRDFSGKDNKEKETDFIDCVAWRNTGEYVSKYFSKGRMAVASGRLETRSWTDKDGNKRKTSEVVIDSPLVTESTGISAGSSERTLSRNQSTPKELTPPIIKSEPTTACFQSSK